MEMPRHIIKELLYVYCDLHTRSFMECYCTHKVAQYHRSELVHISQYRLNNLLHVGVQTQPINIGQGHGKI